MKFGKNLFIYLVLILHGSLLAQNKPDESIAPTSPLSPLSYSFSDYNGLNTQYAKFNYVRVYKPFARLADINSSTSLTNIQVNTSYQNGWGNVIEENLWGTIGTPDLITPVDQRSSLSKYIMVPYVATYGLRNNFIFDPFGQHQVYYNSSTTPEHIEGGYAFGMNTTTPYNGMITDKQMQPGLSMVAAGKGTTEQTWYSNYSDYIYIYNVLSGYPAITGVYTPGSLKIKDIVGPHGQCREYYNVDDQLVCKSVNAGSSVWNTTYYVYNDIGKIVWILTPKIVATLNTSNPLVTATTANLCYSYTYNDNGLLAKTTIPDQQGANYYIYDNKNRLVLQQTPLLASQGKWMFFVYDAEDRQRFSGLVTSGNSYDTWISVMSTTASSGTLPYYLINGYSGTYPTTLAGCEINKYNYYDDYSSLPAPLNGRAPVTTYSLSTGDFLSGAGIETYAPLNTWAKGMLVGSRTRVLDPLNSNLWINTVYFYDKFNRLVQTQSLNPWNTIDWDVNCKQYSFSGHVVMDINEHHSWTASTKYSTVVRTKYNYENFTDVLHSVEQKIDNNGWRELSNYFYQRRKLMKKTLGGAEIQNYTYNVRGQLTSINDEHVKDNAKNDKMTYGEDISYDFGFNSSRYDGSIAGFVWRGSGAAAMPRAYGYNYDYAGRLAGADFNQRQNPFTTYPSSWANSSVDYTVSNVSYDVNGNLGNLRQMGMVSGGPSTPVQVDNLTYNYVSNTNKLSSVADNASYHNPDYDFLDGHTGSGDYDYDQDGNLKKDLNKAITGITYNYMDLPLSVTAGSKSIANIYDANGTLLQKTVSDGSGTKVYRYWGPFTYLNNDLQEITHDEGRSRYLGNGAFALDFYVKDHLGNVRTVVNSRVEDINTYKSDPGTIPPGGIEPVRIYHAGFEVLSANVENAVFTSIDSVREVSPQGTPDDQMSGALDGSDPVHRVGAAVMLHVMTGDEFNAKAFGYYGQEDSAYMNTYCQPMDMMNSVLNTLQTGTYGLNFGELGSIPGISPTVPSSVLTPANYNMYESIKNSITDPAYPRTYLNILMFDENMNIVPDLCKAVQLVGNSNAWNIMDAGNFTIDRPGYLLMYLSNESGRKSYVDNFHFYNIVGDLVQEEHYYPHGLHFDYSLASGTLQNNNLYQGKKLQREIGLNLYDFHARQYDAQIGRFWGVDPASQFPSGYTGMGNDPANLIDPTGAITFNSTKNNWMNSDGSVNWSALFNGSNGDGIFLTEEEREQIASSRPGRRAGGGMFLSYGHGGGSPAPSQFVSPFSECDDYVVGKNNEKQQGEERLKGNEEEKDKDPLVGNTATHRANEKEKTVYGNTLGDKLTTKTYVATKIGKDGKIITMNANYSGRKFNGMDMSIGPINATYDPFTRASTIGASVKGYSLSAGTDGSGNIIINGGYSNFKGGLGYGSEFNLTISPISAAIGVSVGVISVTLGPEAGAAAIEAVTAH